VVDMPAGTVQIVFSDALLFEPCKCHASTSAPDLRRLRYFDSELRIIAGISASGVR
jgi:hypothetical protein